MRDPQEKRPISAADEFLDDLSNSRQGDEELDWLAFRFVAGELSEQATEAFESRLEFDLAAQEAVEQAVLLTRNVSSAFEAPLPVTAGLSGSSQPRQWHSVLLAAAAVMLLSLAGIWYSFQTETIEVASLDSDSVAVVWADLLNDVSTEAELDLTDEPIELALDTDESSEQVDWMIAALADLDLDNGEKLPGDEDAK